jgi:hypothetical protein
MKPNKPFEIGLRKTMAARHPTGCSCTVSRKEKGGSDIINNNK